MKNGLFVTDTHPLIYYFCGKQNRLGKKALKIFREAADLGSSSIFVPTAVLWELSILAQSGGIALRMPFSAWLDLLFQNRTFNPAPFEIETLKIFHDLRFHSDPFDRAVVSTALHMDLPLITNDSLMHAELPCELVWD